MRVRDFDELLRALANGLAIQVGYAVLGYHIADVVTGGHHTCALFQHAGNARDECAILHRRRAGQGDNWYAVLGPRGAIDEIKLAADATIKLGADAVGTDLPGEVHFDGRIDRDHTFILRDHEWVVDIFSAVQLN